MKVEDGVAQLCHRLGESLVGAGDFPVRDALADLLEHVTNGKEILESVIVQRVRQSLALALLRLQCVAEQPRPHLREMLDE